MVKRIAETDKMASTRVTRAGHSASLDCLLRAEWHV